LGYTATYVRDTAVLLEDMSDFRIQTMQNWAIRIAH